MTEEEINKTIAEYMGYKCVNWEARKLSGNEAVVYCHEDTGLHEYVVNYTKSLDVLVPVQKL